MKKLTLTILALMLVQVLAMAQHTGGTGRGDFMLGFSPCTNPTSGGEIKSDQTICYNSTPAKISSKTLPTGHTGDLEFRWESSTSSATGGFSVIPAATDSTYQPGFLTAATWYRRLARVGCMTDWTGSVASNVVKMTVSPVTVGGAVTGGTQVCYGSNSTLFTLSGQVGSVQRWEWSTDGTNWNPIANTADTYTATNLVSNTWFRAVVKSGPCLVENSIATQITIFTDFHISGYARYNNNPKTPLNGLKITLTQGGIPIGTPVTTGTTGYYEFAGLVNGTYSLEVASANPGGWLTWNGVNNTDYLLVAMHAAGSALLPENPPVVRVTANVKAPLTTGITTADADAVRYAAKYGWGSPVPYFDIPKWVFSGTTGSTGLSNFALSCTNVSRDILGLCAGDVNGSYLPSYGLKQAAPGLEVVNRGQLDITPEITFPVRAESDMEIGAITLMLDFDSSLLEITGVEMPDKSDEAPYFFVTRDASRMAEGVLNIGWMSLNPLNVKVAETILLIRARMKTDESRIQDQGSRIRFTLDSNPLSELADGDGNVVENAKLAMPDASPLPTDHSLLLIAYPNPVSDILNIEFLMDKDGLYKAELVNLQGVLILGTGKADGKAGRNKATMNLIDVPNGAYMLTVFCDSGKQTVKVVVNR